jgi:hypothetical protein
MWTPEVCPNCKTDYSVIPGFPFQELAYGSWEDTVQEVLTAYENPAKSKEIG